MISSGCLDFLDEETTNGPPIALEKTVVTPMETLLNFIGISTVMMETMKVLGETSQIMGK